MSSINLLLDTNAFMWLTDDKKAGSIGRYARRLIENADEVNVSTISIVELRMKAMLGKLVVPDLQLAMLQSGLKTLDFKWVDADAITEFQSLAHHDPFDRMLLAQASARNLTFLTADSVLLGLGLPFVVDATV